MVEHSDPPAWKRAFRELINAEVNLRVLFHEFFHRNSTYLQESYGRKDVL